jgi:putative tryptophan/tyrosine transport system substrate-binding protein
VLTFITAFWGDAMNRRAFIAAFGCAVVWPRTARAQQPAMPMIGYLSGWSPGDAPDYLAYFRQGLAAAGFAEGRNVAIEYR